MVITLLNDKENHEGIKKMCDDLGLKHFHICLQGANQEILKEKETVKMLSTKLIELHKILMHAKEKAIIHCAKGIHRTGTIAYSLLRLFDKE